MARAKCFCCCASATASTFEEAIKKLNHAVGLSRGIRCRNLLENIYEIDESTLKRIQPTIKKEIKIEKVETKKEEPKIETSQPISKVESKKPKKQKSKAKKVKQ